MISTNFNFIGDRGVNPTLDNTGDRFTIGDNEGLPLASFIGNLGWDAFLNGKYDRCIELSNKALLYDSTLLFVKLNIALTKLKQKSPEYLNAYLSAIACCKNIEERKETLESSLADINTLVEKEEVPNADKAIEIINSELVRIRNAEIAIKIEKENEINEIEKKQKKEQQEKIDLLNSDYGKILSEIKIDLNRWEIKSQFENEIEYKNRIKNEKENQFIRIRNDFLQKFKLLNNSLLNDNLSLVGQVSKYDAENKFIVIQPAMIESGNERSVTVAIPNNYNKTFSNDYNNVAKNSTYSLILSSDLAQTISRSDDKEILIIPKEFTLYNNNWHISKAFIIFNFDHSPGTVKSITASDQSVSIDVDVFVPAKNAVLVNIPSRTKTKTLELLKFSDLENAFKTSRTIPEKMFFYYWTLDNDPNFSREKSKELNFNLADIENLKK